MLELQVSYHARYKDGKSYKVLYDPTERKTFLATEDGGKMNVPFYVDGAEFVECYFTGPRGISTQYAWTLRSHMDQLLTRPAKPAEPPIPKVDDSRLHVEPRAAGQSSFRQLQEANVARVNAERKLRELARAETQNAAAQTIDTNVRDINEQLARQLKPRGSGTSVAFDIPQVSEAEIAIGRNRDKDVQPIFSNTFEITASAQFRFGYSRNSGKSSPCRCKQVRPRSSRRRTRLDSKTINVQRGHRNAKFGASLARTVQRREFG